ncbi:hypothetical protein PQO05_05805 [Mucilaginibacter jinjuensis]|uniref:Uncharacterized protein n=1 Tax=Mucilaginibacter jinjuensis TaxID=1176721 RepID=A0ABY7TE48_9SPHI|nr:hypothetical protein [Mucilaginibacter jinjuensis]WCT13447.1 hypothetical protein PQO05_05805 [Mucilaginibacter jinjuensis]
MLARLLLFIFIFRQPDADLPSGQLVAIQRGNGTAGAGTISHGDETVTLAFSGLLVGDNGHRLHRAVKLNSSSKPIVDKSLGKPTMNNLAML